MSDSLPSDDLAEDFRSSLEDLAMNSRIEISNLTIIAKENMAHASTLSRVLVNHVKRTHPDKKLPALYVLDSIVKNVGSPYTIFLGHDLYRTFMDAYTAVNEPVRRKLDEMLKTWKEPVPGSIETRPVFPIENIRPIENALIKARTAAVQQQQEQMRRQHELLNRARPTATPPTGWRNTTTPPMTITRYPPPPGYIPPAQSNAAAPPQSSFVPSQAQHPNPPPSGHPYSHVPGQAQQYVPSAPASQISQQDLGSLHKDLQDLVDGAKAEWSRNLSDTNVQNRLQNLLNLQQILQTQHLPPDQIQLIRHQVSLLSISAQPNLPVRPITSQLGNVTHLPVGAPSQLAALLQSQLPSSSLPPTPVPDLYTAAQPPPPRIPSPAAQQNLDLSSLLSSNNLANILASVSNPQRPPVTPSASKSQVPTPTLSAPQATLNNIPGNATSGSDSLMDSLRKAGILPQVSETPVNGHTPAAQAPLTSSLPPNDVTLTSASLKMPRPYLIESLFARFPNQCSTCGNRFLATEEGRVKKARHLDWHFRTKMRRDDSIRRGQSRSWYVSELDWIHWREPTDDDPSFTSPTSDPLAAYKAATAREIAKNDPKNKHVLVPNNPTLLNAPCPICQEKFETAYKEDTGEWVWEDAIRLGNRIYHASCHTEVKAEDNGRRTPLSRTATPDSVLGKRKAMGDDTNPLRVKVSKDISDRETV